MTNPYEAMREKLFRFNAWEGERLKRTSVETRLKRFLLLHDLGRSWDSSVIEKRQAQHLQSLVACGKRLNEASSRHHRKRV